MRICVLAEHFPPSRGGLAKSSERISRGLASLDNEVHVIINSPDLPPGDMESRESDNLITHRLGPFPKEDYTSMMACRTIELLHRRHPFDAIIGIYLVRAGYLAALQGKILNIPSVALARGNDVDRGLFRPENMPFVMGALDMAGAVGCVSRELAAKCKAVAGKNNVHYAPNGVDGSVFTPGEPDESLKSSLELAGPVVGFSGELRFKKGMNHLLEAALKLAPKFPGLKFLLLGGVRRDSKKEYGAALEQNPALKKILVETDYITDYADLCRHYRLMDVMFLPSYWEGMPNACLEAMACGLPVVSSTAGGLKDLVESGVNGETFMPGDFNGALEAISNVLSLSPEKRRMMGGFGREKALLDFTRERELDRIMEIVRGIT